MFSHFQQQLLQFQFSSCAAILRAAKQQQWLGLISYYRTKTILTLLVLLDHMIWLDCKYSASATGNITCKTPTPSCKCLSSVVCGQFVGLNAQQAVCRDAHAMGLQMCQPNMFHIVVTQRLLWLNAWRLWRSCKQWYYNVSTKYIPHCCGTTWDENMSRSAYPQVDDLCGQFVVIKCLALVTLMQMRLQCVNQILLWRN